MSHQKAKKFSQRWITRGNMKDRTSALHPQTLWTMAAPKTSQSSQQQIWRTWRSITTLGRIRAATPHREWWNGRGHVCVGICFSFGLLPEEPELTDSDGRPMEIHYQGDVSALLTRKLLTWSGAPVFGITTLPTQKTLWRTVKSVCCVYVSVN